MALEEVSKRSYPWRVISALIADDHGIVREGLRRLLEAEPDISVCAEASDGREALELAAKHRPGLVILDITMPRLGGLETLERLRAEHPGMKVILLSMHGDPTFIESAVVVRRCATSGACDAVPLAFEFAEGRSTREAAEHHPAFTMFVFLEGCTKVH